MIAALVVFLAVSGVVIAVPDEVPRSSRNGKISALDRAVDAICEKEVVLLGEESSHSSGRTALLKGELLKRLVQECGFSLVVFEAAVYDFLAFEQSLAEGKASSGFLANTIGGLWAYRRETQSLIDFLFVNAAQGHLKVQGLDPQLGGSTQTYAKNGLSSDLARYLNGPAKYECQAEIRRLAAWEFDATHPFDDLRRKRLMSCLSDIEKHIQAQGQKIKNEVPLFLLSNVKEYLGHVTDNSWVWREQAMFGNFEWHRRRLGHGRKVIIWCATVHAAKRGNIAGQDGERLGSYIHREYGDRAAAIGFSALVGTIAKRGQTVQVLPPLDPDAIEVQAFSRAPKQELTYLDRNELEAIGYSPGRVLNYLKPWRTRWDKVIDGLIILREERHPDYIDLPR